MGMLCVLHLSDLHFGNTIRKEPESIAISIVRAVKGRPRSTPINCVVISGDLMDGRCSDVATKQEKVLVFLNCLSQKLDLSPENFVIVPGNHDLRREEKRLNLDDYESVLKRFYGEELYARLINNRYFYTLRIYHQEKVALIGLNSCMLKTLSVEKEEIEWIEQLENFSVEQKNMLREALEKKKKNQWDDYGEIDVLQLDEAFTQLKKEVGNPEDYTLVACFHHHFYPFPETYERFGDSSLMRNFTEVIENMQREKVKLVMHGHKHLPIIRPVSNEYCLHHPDSVLYVLAAGSACCAETVNRSFQVVEVYSPKENIIANICRFKYKDEQQEEPEYLELPPQREEEGTFAIELETLFKRYYREEYEQYKSEIYEADYLSSHNRLRFILENLSRVVTPFETFKKDLINDPRRFLGLLLPVHYRINYLETICHGTSGSLIPKLQAYFSVFSSDKGYLRSLFQLIEHRFARDFVDNCDQVRLAYPQYQRQTAYVVIALFFTELYLVFSRYGEVYYKNERIHANIKLEENTFHSHLPVEEIYLRSDDEYRRVTLCLKCTDPTIHKIAVLIAKDFEKRMMKLEEYFRLLDIKLYYLSPKVEKTRYDLDNFNFEAYIPKLLPLLIGDHLYKNKQVFIRELIQNAFDAIMLKEKLLSLRRQQVSEEDKIIRVRFGKEKKTTNARSRRFIQVIDRGIGMDRFKVERYFTSIGRSFYKSEDFEELQKNEHIEYQPISYFGIGFLSAFMVCKELEVVTKSFDNLQEGLKIHIPNYDGCFFVNTLSDPELPVGTQVTLYEEEDFYVWHTDEIIRYIKDTFVDFELKIRIENELSNSVLEIPSYQFRAKEVEFRFFCPLDKEKPLYLPIKEVIDGSYLGKYRHGVTWCLTTHKSGKSSPIYLNSGIFLSHSNQEELELNEFDGIFYYNLPSSYLELDVAREVIRGFRGNSISKAKLIGSFYLQYKNLLENVGAYFPNRKLHWLNQIYKFTIPTNLTTHNRWENNYYPRNTYCYALNCEEDKGNIIIGIKLKQGYLGFVDNRFCTMMKVFYYNLKRILSHNRIFPVDTKGMFIPISILNFLYLRTVKEETSNKSSLKKLTLKGLSEYYDVLYDGMNRRDYLSDSNKSSDKKGFYAVSENLVILASNVDNGELHNLYHSLEEKNENKYQTILDLLTLKCFMKFKQHLPVRSIPQDMSEMTTEIIRSVYILFHLFYESVSTELQIGEVGTFKLEIATSF